MVQRHNGATAQRHKKQAEAVVEEGKACTPPRITIDSALLLGSKGFGGRSPHPATRTPHQ